jgi:endonuclease G
VSVVTADLEAPPVIASVEHQKELVGALAEAQSGTAWRNEPAGRKAAFAQRAGVRVAADADPEELDSALERVLANPDFLPGGWLTRGSAAGDTVALVDSPGRGTATGFLVSPWLLLTNHHVFPTAGIAGEATVKFRYQLEADGRLTDVREHGTDPERFYLSDAHLDYALVAVAPRPSDQGQDPGAVHGWTRMIGAVGKALLGQPVNIVQHPRGRLREIVVRNNLLLTLTDETLTYAADTESGSSGSPIFNDRWELLGLHRRSVEARDEAGVRTDINGRPVTAQTPEEQRNWVANEGTRTSAIVAHLRAQDLSEAQRLLAQDIGG